MPKKSALVSVVGGLWREKSGGSRDAMPGRVHTSGEQSWETVAGRPSVAEAYLDDLGQGQTCLQKLPSGS